MEFNDLIINALIGGFCIASLAGLLGSFVLWQRMAYFGDALSHSSLLGVTIGILYNYSINASVILVCISFASLFSFNKSKYSNDTILGILSYSALSLAIILSSFYKVKMDLMGYLFGDILAISFEDMYYLAATGVIILMWMYFNWAKLVLFCINAELVKAEGVNVQVLKLGFSLILALFVAISFKIVGVLLITAMLILPAAAAFSVSNSPLKMIIYSAIIGCSAVIAGIALAIYFNLPTGPSIIISSLCLFFASNIISYTFRLYQ